MTGFAENLSVRKKVAVSAVSLVLFCWVSLLLGFSRPRRGEETRAGAGGSDCQIPCRDTATCASVVARYLTA